MFGKNQHNTDSSDDKVEQASDYESDVSNVVPFHPDRNRNSVRNDRESAESPSEADLRASVIQMAFLQVMTRKVMEAIANHPDSIKLLNASIRNENAPAHNENAAVRNDEK